MNIIPLSTLKEQLKYEPETGNLIWTVKRPGAKGIGSIAGTITKFGYRAIKLNYKTYKAHLLAWYINTGHYPQHPKEIIDHIDGNRANNRMDNLRLVDTSNNLRNKGYSRKGRELPYGVRLCDTSKWKRPSKHRIYWRAYIRVRGKHIQLGSFKTFEEAYEARKHAERIYGFTTYE